MLFNVGRSFFRDKLLEQKIWKNIAKIFSQIFQGAGNPKIFSQGLEESRAYIPQYFQSKKTSKNLQVSKKKFIKMTGINYRTSYISGLHKQSLTLESF
jgi:hypothetical protein